MWVRSLLSQADAKTRSTGAPHTGSDRDSDRSVHVIGETSVTTKFVYICAKLESVSQLLRGRTRVHHTPSQRTAPLNRCPRSTQVYPGTGTDCSMLNTDVY